MSTTREHAAQNWLPREFVSGLGQLSLEAFCEASRDAYFLLIQLFERHDSLSIGLSAHYLRAASREASAFATAEYVTASALMREGAALPLQEVAEPLVAAENRLRLARTPGGEEHVGESLRVGLCRRGWLAGL